MGEVSRESRIDRHIFPDRFPNGSLAVDSIVAHVVCSGIYERFDFNDPYLPFFAPKIADAIILYSRKVLTFNRHLNRNREFTMITGNTLRDHF